MPTLNVIVASTRPGRVGPAVTGWFIAPEPTRLREAPAGLRSSASAAATSPRGVRS